MTKGKKKAIWKKADVDTVTSFDFNDRRLTEDDLTLVKMPAQVISGAVSAEKFIEMSAPTLHKYPELRRLIRDFALSTTRDVVELGELAEFLRAELHKSSYESDRFDSLLSNPRRLADAAHQSSYFVVADSFTPSNNGDNCLLRRNPYP